MRSDDSVRLVGLPPGHPAAGHEGRVGKITAYSQVAFSDDDTTPGTVAVEVPADCVEEVEPAGEATERTEIAREFINPLPGDTVCPWDPEFHGEPDLTRPPPSASRGLPMRWVTRTVTYGPWRPVEVAADA